MKNKYVIMTDSCCDLDAAKVKELDLEVVPLSYDLEGKTHPNDPEKMTNAVLHHFYQKMREGSSPKTTQVNPHSFKERLLKHLEKGSDVMYLGFSSALSGTYQSFCIAAKELKEKFPKRNIIAIDTLSASLGQGLLATYASKNRNSGMDLNKNANWCEKSKLKIAHYFTIDDLSTLRRGGRLSHGKALVATVLMIKPMLHMDDAGRLVPIGRAYGRKKALESLVAGIEKNIVNPHDQEIYISHGDCLDEAEEVAKMIKEQYKPKNIYINMVGPVIGSHSGPGTISVFYMATGR